MSEGGEKGSEEKEEKSEKEKDEHSLISFKRAFDACNRNGVLMVYVCKLFSIQGCDIQGFPAGTRRSPPSPHRARQTVRDRAVSVVQWHNAQHLLSLRDPVPHDAVIATSTTHAQTSHPSACTHRPPRAAVPSRARLHRRFILMGRDIVAVNEVPAGNVFGVLGLEGSIMKSGTLSDSPSCPSLSSLRFAVVSHCPNNIKSDPIVQIAIETEKSNDMPQLLHQLEILNNNDSSVQVSQSVPPTHSFHL